MAACHQASARWEDWPSGLPSLLAGDRASAVQRRNCFPREAQEYWLELDRVCSIPLTLESLDWSAICSKSVRLALCARPSSVPMAVPIYFSPTPVSAAVESCERRRQ